MVSNHRPTIRRVSMSGYDGDNTHVHNPELIGLVFLCQIQLMMELSDCPLEWIKQAQMSNTLERE